MSSRSRSWQPWAMGPLERRGPRIERGKNDGSPRSSNEPVDPPRRRREDEIARQLFELAKSEAAEKGYNAGHAEGYAAGYAEGESKVRAEHATRLDTELATALVPIERLVTEFSAAVEAMNERIARHLAELAIETGRQLAGRALDIAPEHILDDIQDLIEDHPGLSGTPTLYVAAEDHPRVSHHLGQTLAGAGWTLRIDASLVGGDCRLEDDERELDSSAADRWHRLLQAVGHEEH